MSYSCYISFKTVKENELYSFLKQFKDVTTDKLSEIANEFALWCPSERLENITKFKEYPVEIIRQINEAWAFRVFTYRFLYLPEHNLLGVFGVPDCIESTFDCTCYFQNATDQDYDYEEWKGIPIFEKIVEKWKATPLQEILPLIREEYDEENPDEECIEYFKKSSVYNEIWKMCEKFLYMNNEAVNISLFNQYEYRHIHNFLHFCKEYATEKRKAFVP